ncbi:hypothetical protein [Streptomyces sp. cf386]|uniref:hypothetical protein n=1 Tax=Streptomyces sp. cf386 TaxID=1761904 RepID=UPI00210E72DF|nr:hypothetical protein [Streptomyces sp. cf386]
MAVGLAERLGQVPLAEAWSVVLALVLRARRVVPERGAWVVPLAQVLARAVAPPVPEAWLAKAVA